MNIAFVLNSFPVVSETFIVNQICSLIDEGHKVTILVFKKNNCEVIHNSIIEYKLLDKVIYWSPEPKNKTTRILGVFKSILNKNKFDITNVLKLLNPFKYGKRALSLHYLYKNQWFLKENMYNVIHCHFAQTGIFISQLRKEGFLTNEKVITSFHGCDIAPDRINEYKNNYKILFKYVDLFTYNSLYSLEILKKITNIDDNFKFLPVGLDTQRFKKRKITKHNNSVFKILFCGRLVPFKGPDLAIEIVKKLIDKKYKVHLTLVGDGELKNKLYNLIEKYKIENYVTLKGSIEQDDIINLMDNADLFLLPGIEDTTGRAENQGLVIQEAQSMQLPVIVSDAGGMKYGLIDSVTGHVVEQNNTLKFVDEIEKIINNINLKNKMGIEGRKFVVENYDSKVLCKKLERFYS